MKVSAVHGSIQSFEADTLVVNVLEGISTPGGATDAVDKALGGAIRDVIAAGDISGELGQTTVLYPRGAIPAARVIVVGLGAPSGFGPEAVRRAAAAAARRARAAGASHVASIIHGSGIGGLDVREAVQATVEGTQLGLYRYARDPGLAAFTLVEYDVEKLEAVEDGVRLGQAVSEGVLLARELVRMPANVATPEHLADVARDLAADHGFEVTIGDRAWAREQGLGAFVAVAQAAGFEPRFIVLEHDPSGGKDPPLVLVGKGVTFDSGGLTMKTRTGMAEMQFDMAGAAAVLGTMRTIGRLRSPRRVIALVPATENLIDALGYRPTDVITAADGTTIEIVSTDAEGRLLLADALAYARRLEPRAVVDVATLTGAVVTALGDHAAGLFGNDDALAERLLTAAGRTHERLWRLPLWDEYRTAIQSEVADLKNSSGKPAGGACVAASFLSAFVDYPWAHLDIAGVHKAAATEGYLVEGPTGFGVRLLVDWLTRN
jgi:leucyl aminopeptidase